MKESLLLKCLLISALLHAVAIPIFFGRPLHFHPSISTILGKTTPFLLEERVLDKEIALEEAVKNFIILSSSTSLPEGIKPLIHEINEEPIAETSFIHPIELSLPTTPEIVLPEVLPAQPLSLSDEIDPMPLFDHSLVLLPTPSTIQTLELEIFDKPSHQPIEGQPLATDTSLDFEFYPSQEQFDTPSLAAPLLPSIFAATDTVLL